MERLFSMFPQGGPGFALLLMRVSVALTFLVEILTRTDGTSFHMLFAGSVLISASLTIGFLTPFVSIVACASAAALLIGHPKDILVLVPLALNSVALGFSDLERIRWIPDCSGGAWWCFPRAKVKTNCKRKTRIPPIYPQTDSDKSFIARSLISHYWRNPVNRPDFFDKIRSATKLWPVFAKAE